MTSTQSPIIASDLVRTFGSGEDEVRAVDGVNLEVTAGEVFGFLGPNGAGKSTTVRILTTLLKPSAGSASVAGYDIETEADAVLYGIPRNAQHERAGELLERVGLSAAGDRRVGTYSGGMRRRLDLALALIHEPSVLFLDEPTTGLDPMSRMSLWEEIRRLNNDGTTVLLTTQYLEEADQ
ncbi:MAG: ABC transporter ATP-binding protein, partial [Ilumatobacteraceae bacterium]